MEDHSYVYKYTVPSDVLNPIWMTKLLSGSLFLSVPGPGKVWRMKVGRPEVAPDFVVTAFGARVTAMVCFNTDTILDETVAL